MYIIHGVHIHACMHTRVCVVCVCAHVCVTYILRIYVVPQIKHIYTNMFSQKILRRYQLITGACIVQVPIYMHLSHAYTIRWL